jgi:hypothetical protein
VDLKVRKFIVQLCGCDGDNDDAFSEAEKDATDDILALKICDFFSFYRRSQRKWLTHETQIIDSDRVLTATSTLQI